MKLSQHVQSIAESATLAVSAKAAQMRADGIDVISFGAGEPDFPTPEHIVRACKKALDEGHTRYSKPASGLLELKEAIQTKLRRDNQLDYAIDQIVVTVGGKIAVNLALQTILDPGDEVLIPVPYWVSYPEMVKLAGGVPVFIEGSESNGLCVTAEQIRRALTKRTTALIFNSPSNPGGHYYRQSQVREIAAAIADTEMAVISDEIYDRLIFEDEPGLSFAAVDKHAYQRTLTINSASKTYAMTGWRLGFAAGPADVVKGIAKLQSQGTSGAVTFAQKAYAVALLGAQSCVDEMRAEFAKRGEFTLDRLTGIDGITCVRPSGAFYAFPNVSATYQRVGVSNSLEFADKLLSEARVAVVPGAAFGSDANVRISFATSLPQIEEGIERIRRFVESR